jgi:UDP-MurNAc hydroxylase
MTVSAAGTTVLFDPWLVGSSYWRSWWNYPSVSPELIASLRPDYIYLTHIHWDHFHGVTLKKFDRSTPILVPKAHYPRMKDDLGSLGFHNVIELAHGETFRPVRGFALTSYHSHLFLDSAAVVEADGVTLLNANDCKLMGLPLQQVLKRHPKIDFVFRSHSSANARLCYEVIGEPAARADDPELYLRDFARFVCATKAKYAVPFASNHCFLHPEVFGYNHTITTPRLVEDYFERNGIDTPELRIMVSGDSWSSKDGFSIAENDWFERREEHLEAYRERERPRIERHTKLEERVNVKLPDMEKYFARFCAAIPWPVKRMFRGRRVTWVLASGDRSVAYAVDIASGKVQQVTGPVTDDQHPMQIHTSAFIMKRCLISDLFSHLPISKRVRYRTTRALQQKVKLLNMLFTLYEYEMLPVRKVFSARFAMAWMRRWREVLLYASMVGELLLTRRLDLDRRVPSGRRFAGDVKRLTEILPS